MKTIGVKEKGHRKIKEVSKKHHLSNGEFVELAAEFFLKTGIDPSLEYSLNSELKEHNKRMSQVIAWITRNEKDFVIPISNDLERNNKKLEEYLNRITPEALKESYARTKERVTSLEERVTDLKDIIYKQNAVLNNQSKLLVNLNNEVLLLLEGFAVDSQKLENKSRKEVRAKVIDYLNQ